MTGLEKCRELLGNPWLTQEEQRELSVVDESAASELADRLRGCIASRMLVSDWAIAHAPTGGVVRLRG